MAEKKDVYCVACDKNLGQDYMVCKRCKKVPYCSTKCEGVGWKSHKPMCRPFDFGVTPEQYSKYLQTVNTGQEVYYVANQDISKYTEILVDDPIFFMTVYDLEPFGKDQKKILSGETKGRLFSMYDNKLEKFESNEAKLLYLASKKAQWLKLEPIVKIAWNPAELASNSSLFPRFKVTDKFLQHMAGEKEVSQYGLLPYDLYYISFHLFPSLTPVYSRSIFNVIGSGLFMNAWKFSLSCAPNCTTFFSKGKLRVMAIRPINKGEQLTIGLHPMTILKSLAERKADHASIFGIRDCICSRCKHEMANGSVDTPVSKEANDAVQYLLNSIRPMINGSATADDYSNIKSAANALVDPKITKEIGASMRLYYRIDLTVSTVSFQYLLSLDSTQEINEEEKQCISTLSSMATVVLGSQTFNTVDFTEDDTQKIMERTCYCSVGFDSMIHAFIYNFKQNYPHALRLMISESGETIQPQFAMVAKLIRSNWESYAKHIDLDCMDLEMFLSNIMTKDWRASLNYFLNLKV